MSDSKSLKDQNAWLIRAAMIGHMAAFLWMAAQPAKLFSLDSRSALLRLEALAVPGSASLGLIVIATLVLLGLVPPEWRDRIVHLRRTNPLPGCRAFSEIGPRSSHVDMEALSAKWGPFPVEASAQNQLFYKIYKTVRDDIGVCDAHRRYLAARDIATITFILLIPLPVMSFMANGNAARSFVYLGLLCATYLLCAVAAKNYSHRMVQHVLALNGSEAAAEITRSEVDT